MLYDDPDDCCKSYKSSLTLGIGKYPDSFTSLDEKEHASRRKIVNNLYSMSSISRSEDSIDLCTDTLLDKMNSFSESGEIIDMAQWAQMWVIITCHFP